MTNYDDIKKKLAQGWNTWNTRSVLSHVLLPQGFALNLCFREYFHHRYLKEALIGRKNPSDEVVRPGPHAYDGSYTELKVTWEENEWLIQTAIEKNDLVILITPIRFPSNIKRPPLLVVEGGILWNRPGYVVMEGNVLIGHFPGENDMEITIPVFATHKCENDPYAWTQTPYLSIPLKEPVGISTNHKRSIEEIQSIIERHLHAFDMQFLKYGKYEPIARAVQTVMAWDTIYEPEHNRVVSPVSRIWNINWGGFVLFEWDNYFAAYMASMDNRELAYANAVEMTREITENGLVPNFATTNGVSSRDRSEPPVGAMICRELYRKYGEIWFLEEVYPNLLKWNRWWHAKRNLNGLLCWGSEPYEPVNGAFWETYCVNTRQGGAWESGLDNLPLFDDIPFDTDSHLLLLHDVGLNSLYIADCEALADIARVLVRLNDVDELKTRAAKYREQLEGLWSKEHRMYLNRHPETNHLDPRIALSNFYPLLAKVPTQEQANWMIKEHFYNSNEFWGEWIIPNTPRNDPAFQDQIYWRGRIWGPTNFLVYIALRNYHLPDAQRDLVDKSTKLFLKEWLENGHIHENYNAITGEGCDSQSSDAFYHWGGLLGIIQLIEAGFMPAPEKPI